MSLVASPWVKNQTLVHTILRLYMVLICHGAWAKTSMELVLIQMVCRIYLKVTLTSSLCQTQLRNSLCTLPTGTHQWVKLQRINKWGGSQLVKVSSTCKRVAQEASAGLIIETRHPTVKTCSGIAAVRLDASSRRVKLVLASQNTTCTNPTES